MLLVQVTLVFVMTLLLIVLSCALGGLGRRVAGGAFEEWTGLDIGDLPVRVFFGCTLAAAGALGGMDLYQWLCLPISTMLGCSIPMFNSITLGNGPGDDKDRFWQEVAGLTAHGVISMAITAVPLGLLATVFSVGSIWQVFPFLIAGMLSVPCYLAGWQITGKLGFLPMVPRRTGIGSATEFGEVFWGACCGLGAFIAGVMT